MDFSRLPYTGIIVEKTSEGRNKTSMSFDGNRLLIVTDMQDSEEVIFTFFIDRKLIAASVMNSNELIDRMEKYFTHPFRTP
jgi:hypothetical protein